MTRRCSSRAPPLPRSRATCSSAAIRPPSLRRPLARCAVVTMEAVTASNLSVLVDRQAATLHPMGRVVRPHLQSPETAGHIAELVAPLPGPEERPPDVTAGPRGRPDRTGVADGRRCGPGPGAGSGGRASPHHDAPDRRTPRRPSAQSGPSGGGARRLSGSAPARCHYERSAPHQGPRVIRRRRRGQDALQHRLRGPSRPGGGRARRSVLPRRDPAGPVPALAPRHRRRATGRGARGRG